MSEWEMTTKVTMETHHCPVCSIVYSAPKAHFNKKRETGDSFYCPNGHCLTYKENDYERMRRERDRLVQAMAEKNDTIDRLVAEKFSATQEAKRLARRAHSGTCPHCNRTFANMARHMRAQHPDAVKAVLVK